MNLAEKLVALRKEKGLNQLDLAERLNVSRQAISRWEVGSSIPSIDNLRLLSELYGISLDELLSDTVQNISNDANKQEEKIEKREINDSKSKRYLLVLVSGLLIAMMLVIVIMFGVQKRNKENLSGTVSITDINCDPTPNEYPVETAHLIPID